MKPLLLKLLGTAIFESTMVLVVAIVTTNGVLCALNAFSVLEWVMLAALERVVLAVIAVLE